MKTSHLTIALVLLFTIGILVGLINRYNSPSQVAKRYLHGVIETATVEPTDTPLNRRLRTRKLNDLLANPLEISLASTRYSDTYDLEELLSGYLYVVMKASFFEPKLIKLRLIENAENAMILHGLLRVDCDYPDPIFPLNRFVELEIKKLDGLLLLSRISSLDSST